MDLPVLCAIACAVAGDLPDTTATKLQENSGSRKSGALRGRRLPPPSRYAWACTPEPIIPVDVTSGDSVEAAGAAWDVPDY
jgi:hypothetical protein